MDCENDLAQLQESTGTSWFCNQWIFPDNQGQIRGDCKSQLEQLNAFDYRVQFHCAGGDKSFPVPGIEHNRDTCNTQVAILNEILGGVIERQSTPPPAPATITCHDWSTRVMDCANDLAKLEQATGTTWFCDQWIFPDNQGSIRSNACEAQLEQLNAFDHRVQFHCAGGDKSFPVPGIEHLRATCDAQVAILNDILGGMIEREPTPLCGDFSGYYTADGWSGELSVSIEQHADCTAEVCHWGGDSCEDHILVGQESILGAQLNDLGELVAHFTQDTVNFIRIAQEYCDLDNYQCSEPNAYCGFGVNNDKCWCGDINFPERCNKPREDRWIMFKVDGQKSCTSECNNLGMTCNDDSPAIDTQDAIDEVVTSLGGQCNYFRGPWAGAWSPGYRPSDGRCMMKRRARGQHCDTVLAYNSGVDSSAWDNRKLCYCTVEN